MPVWAWVLIAVVIIVIAAAAAWRAVAARRTQSLQQRFGPEYDRLEAETGDRRAAEAELAAREQRREQLNIRPLAPEARARFAQRWETVQAQFVDSPPAAIAAADSLVTNVMAERGYPMEDFDQRAADISVDHPAVVESYRKAHDLSTRAQRGEATTEDLRQAMQNYRSLFDELLGGGADEPVARDAQTTAGEETERGRRTRT
ncbi:MAG TPA: hypothetical protein VFA05_09255 [Gaiellaceae bacterium]|nr:hypothetical protein [Gaiellaceae bacterium]